MRHEEMNYKNVSFRLEWNEKKQQWHYDRFNHPENINGWVTIVPIEKDEILKKFTYGIDSVNRKFTTDDIKLFWELFKAFNLPYLPLP